MSEKEGHLGGAYDQGRDRGKQRVPDSVCLERESDEWREMQCKCTLRKSMFFQVHLVHPHSTVLFEGFSCDWPGL